MKPGYTAISSTGIVEAPHPGPPSLRAYCFKSRERPAICIAEIFTFDRLNMASLMQHARVLGSSLLAGSSRLVCPRLDVPQFVAPSRTFRTSLVVQMGRRAAKIALRKVSLWHYCLVWMLLLCCCYVETAYSPDAHSSYIPCLRTSLHSRMRNCSSLAVAMPSYNKLSTCYACGSLRAGQGRCKEGESVRQNRQEAHPTVSN
jgi:hypothetical protein